MSCPLYWVCREVSPQAHPPSASGGLAGPEPSSGLISRPNPFLPAPLCAHPSMCPLSPFAHPLPPNPRQQSLRQKRRRVHCLLVRGPRHHPTFPSIYPPFPPFLHPGVCPCGWAPTWSLSAAASGADVQPSQTSGSRGAGVASPWLAIPEDRAVGQWRPFRVLGRAGRVPEGLTCHAWSHAWRKTVAGGGSGVVSEAHSTLIHKVGNTTPSSAVSSAFYFMGDCTVCLSICRFSSGRPLSS